MTKLKSAGCFVSAFLLGTLAFGDSLELKNGSLIKGQYMGGTKTEVSFQVGSSIQHYPVSDVVSLKFDEVPVVQARASSTPAQPSSLDRTSDRTQPALASRPAEATAPARTPTVAARPTSSGITAPTGSRLLVRTIDSIDSATNQIGDKFQASLEEPLIVDGSVAAPKGSIVYGRLEESKAAGQIAGKSELRLSLTGIVAGGRTIALTTGDYSVSGSSRSASSAKRVGGGAAVGALIGAIAGGGKGAAIGAGVGAGAGTAVQVMTKGEQVKVPSETLLEFALDQPLTLPAQ